MTGYLAPGVRGTWLVLVAVSLCMVAASMAFGGSVAVGHVARAVGFGLLAAALMVAVFYLRHRVRKAANMQNSAGSLEQRGR